MRRSLGLVLLLSLVSVVAPAAAAEPDLDARTARVLLSYARDPRGQRQALLDLERGGTDGLPAPVMLALADAHMRGGRFDMAGDRCAEVIDRSPGEPWQGWAVLCRGWADVAAGRDDSEAQALLDTLARSDSDSRLLASFVAGVVFVAHGRLEDAHYAFSTVAARASEDDLHAAGALCLGFTRFWKGEWREAADEFRALTTDPRRGAYDDDARYALARTELELGRTDRVVADLRRLAQRGRRDDGVAYVRAVDLEPREILGAAVYRYRRARVRTPTAQVTAAFNGNGAALARALLRRLEHDGSVPADASAADARPVARPATPVAVEIRGRPDGPAAQDAGDARSRWPWALGAIVALVLASIVWLGASRRNAR